MRIGTNQVSVVASILYAYTTAVFHAVKQTPAGILVISIILNGTLDYDGSFNLAEIKAKEPHTSPSASQLHTCIHRSVQGHEFHGFPSSVPK